MNRRPRLTRHGALALHAMLAACLSFLFALMLFALWERQPAPPAAPPSEEIKALDEALVGAEDALGEVAAHWEEED